MARAIEPPRIAPGAPIRVILNIGSGHHDDDDRRTRIEALVAEAGRCCEVHEVDRPAQLASLARESAEAAALDGGIVVAAGGDGTINTVAHEALRAGCAFGALPQGTFNYFGRCNGIPEALDDAVRALLRSQPVAIQAGRVNDRAFLVNASLGLYPRLLEDREASKHQYGRSRLVAICAGIRTIARGQRALRIEVELDGATRTLRTPTVFVGNNRLQLEQIGLSDARELAHDRLVAILLAPVGAIRLLWLLLRGAFGRLEQARDVVSFPLRRMSVRAAGRGTARMKVATDGEVGWMTTPIVFSVADAPLWLMLPPSESSQ